MRFLEPIMVIPLMALMALMVLLVSGAAVLLVRSRKIKISSPAKPSGSYCCTGLPLHCSRERGVACSACVIRSWL